MNKKTALKATLILLVILGVCTGLIYLMSMYKEIIMYMLGGLFLSLMWVMVYDTIENMDKLKNMK